MNKQRISPRAALAALRRAVAPVAVGAAFLYAGPAVATVIEDPDAGDIGDFFKFFTLSPTEEAPSAIRATAEWVTATRAERGITAPLAPTTAAEARAEIVEPPLAPDEVRFSVDEKEGMVEYLLRDETVSLYRGARVAYRDITLTAERIRFFSGKDLVVAEGYAELTDPQQTLLGVRMSYDLESERGVVLEGEAESAQGFYGGKRVKKMDEKTIAAYRGSFTTCDLGYPHYRFWSPKLKVYLEDKVVARPAVLFVGSVPVAAAPFYFFSLRKDRHSGFLPPYIRYYREGEFVVNNGFYWVLNDYADVTFLLDYDSRRGWNKAANLVYLYGSRSTVNNFYAAHMRERDTATEWWKIYATHRQDFTDSCAALVRLDLRNSTAYDDVLEPEFEIRTERALESFVNISQSWTNYQISAEARRTQTKTTEKAGGGPAFMFTTPPHELEPWRGIIQKTSDPFPRFLFYASRQELADTNFYYQYGAEWVDYYNFEGAGSVLKEGTVDASGSRPFTLFRYLRTDPAVNGHLFWFDRDRFGRNQRWLGTWDTSVALSTKIYGIFEGEETTFRHIINPAVTHYYRPEFDQSWMVSGGAVQEEQNMLGINLTQTFDLKLPAEEEGAPAAAAPEIQPRSWEEVYRPERAGIELPEKTTISRLRAAPSAGTVVNLATWTTSTTYDFTPAAYAGDRPFSDLVNTVEISPNFADWYTVDHRVEFVNDFYDWTLLDFDVSTTVSFTSARREKPTPGEEPLDESWDRATDPYGRPRTPESEDLDPNVYPIDTITHRRYEAGEGMGKGWNLSLTHDYSWSNPAEGTGFGLHTLRGAFSFDLTKKWRLGYDAYYDIEEGQLISEHYRIYRNLHRWEAEVRISFERQEVQYWFQIRLVDLPEIQLYGTRHREY